MMSADMRSVDVNCTDIDRKTDIRRRDSSAVFVGAGTLK